ncbi:homocysteine S-methyltransferase [Plasmodium gonderi]|uniref:Homocysteine S-methyltransferase n=1 Tax=Plasmodium gonderi TaxID=77519 RepID=A0A1Y1JSD1_PLAGO|nr:homocysteine S-methyltransferase [Plasmodium gonderi]GAW83712.1 homocysteine S-methyltransferase [Plasmodium gonderi]
MVKEIYTLDGGKISEFERLRLGNFDFLSCRNDESENGINNKEEMMNILENIHLSYLLAGSNVITTNTFQVNLYSLREKNMNIEQGERIINTYIDIAYNAMEKFQRIKKRDDFALLQSEKRESIYNHLEYFQKVRSKIGIVHPNDSVNVKDYVDSFDLWNVTTKKGMGGRNEKDYIRRCKNYYVAFSNGSYSSAFCDFSEYSGVMHKGGGEEEEEEEGRKTTEWKTPSKKNTIRRKHFDIKINTDIGRWFTPVCHNKQHDVISMVPVNRTEIKNATTMDSFLNRKLFNYGLEYYIDVSDEEIISNCKFKLGSFSRNRDKVELFSLVTCSNIREVFTFYNLIKYYGGIFQNNVVINFYCNSNKYIGCSGYSFFDVVLILLYLDSFNKYIKAIGVNCVNIDYVHDLFFPIKKFVSSYYNIRRDTYKSENVEINTFVNTLLNNLKKNRCIDDVHFFASPNKSLKQVSYDSSKNHINFETLHEPHKHVYNYVDSWLDLGLSGFGGCCYYNPYDISLLDYKLGCRTIGRTGRDAVRLQK